MAIWVEAQPDKAPASSVRCSAFPSKRSVSLSHVLCVATHEQADSSV